MAIKEFITLEGVETVQAQLKKLADVGEQALSDFRKQAGDVIAPTIEVPKVDTQPIQDLTQHTLKLSEAFHILRPVLAEMGIKLGEFGALSRLAGAGLGALGIAISGAVVVALAKLEENAARAKGQLDDLFGGSSQGQKVFQALSGEAGKFGTTVESLIPGIESLKRALDAVADTKGFVALNVADLPGVSRGVDKVTASYENFIKILRAGRLTQDDAQKSAKAFFDTFKEGGPLTVAALQALPVGSLQLLQQALGRGGETAKAFFAEVKDGKITIDNINNALVNFGPQADKAFDSKAIKTMGDEFGKLIDTINKGFGTLTGTPLSDFFSNQIKLFREDVQSIIDLIDKGAQLIRDSAAKSRLVVGGPGLFVGPTLEQAGLAGTAFLPTPEQAGKAGAETAKAFGKNFITNLNFGAAQILPTGPGFVDNFNTAIIDATKETPITIPVTPVIAPDALENLKTDTVAALSNAPIPAFDLSQPLAGFQSLLESVKTMFTNIPVTFIGQGQPSLQSTAPFAGGGMVRGPGSTTSDSILAWLSNKEYVVNARAVSHYGADLFAALNSMRLPRDFIGGFSMGGLARAISGNRFAAGGQVSAGHPVVLNIDRHSFNMSAGGDTIAQLKRFAVTSQLSSTGRKPRWVK